MDSPSSAPPPSLSSFCTGDIGSNRQSSLSINQPESSSDQDTTCTYCSSGHIFTGPLNSVDTKIADLLLLLASGLDVWSHLQRRRRRQRNSPGQAALGTLYIIQLVYVETDNCVHHTYCVCRRYPLLVLYMITLILCSLFSTPVLWLLPVPFPYLYNNYNYCFLTHLNDDFTLSAIAIVYLGSTWRTPYLREGGGRGEITQHHFMI